MRNQFDALIKGLEREVVELKSAKKLATRTLKTMTESIATQATIKSRGGSNTVCTQAALVTINSTDGLPAPYSVAIGGRNGVRGMRVINYNVDDGSAVLIAPLGIDNRDSGMSAGDEKTITFTVYVTSTNNITLTATQVDFEEY